MESVYWHMESVYWHREDVAVFRMSPRLLSPRKSVWVAFTHTLSELLKACQNF
jgi:hypothetical protein